MHPHACRWTAGAAVLAATLLVPPATRAQLPADHAAIASAFAGTPATRLFTVDLVAGTSTPLARFSQDQWPPLALRVDPVNRDLLLAVDVGGSSRVLRLGVSGSAVTRVRVLADVPGLVADMAVTYPGDLAVGVGGAQGGLFLVPRNGGAATPLLAVPRIAGTTTVSYVSSELWLAESGDANTPAQIRMVDTRSGRTVGPNPMPGIQPPTLTGIADLLTSNPTHVLSTASGEVWLSTFPQPPVRLLLSPALPPGATRQVRIMGAGTGLALGGVVFPFLQSFQAYNTNPQAWIPVAAPLPGDPVTFDVAASRFPQVALFGERCSPSGTAPAFYTQGGFPRLGNSAFGLSTTGAPGTLVFLALGTSDQQYLGTLLPATLPAGGCPLLVAPQVTLSAVTNAMGLAVQPLPVPASQSLVGAVFFGQWIHLLGGPLIATTDAMALHVYP